MDISQTCPIPVSNQTEFTLEEANQIERASNDRFRVKEEIYGAISQACAIQFMPIIFETGRLNSLSLEFISHILKLSITGGYLDSSLVRSYWLKRLSITFLKHQAELINNQVKGLHDCTGNIFNYDTSASFIHEFSHLRA